MAGKSGNISRGIRFLFETDLDDAISFAHPVGADSSRGRTAENRSGAKVELCIVPRAGDATVFDGSKSNGGISVRTEVVECV